MQEFTAEELFGEFESNLEFVIVDIRNSEDYSRFSIEGPRTIDNLNIPFDDFLNDEEQSIAQIPVDKAVRVICAKEESSAMIAAIIKANGFNNIGFLKGGINSWGDLLIPKLVNDEGYELWQFIRPAKASCSYALINNEGMFLFDPSRRVDFYTNFLESKGVVLKMVFETHLQADYLSGGPSFEALYAVHEADFSSAPFDFHSLQDDEIFNLEDIQVRCIHSPGHTLGSMTYIIDDKWMISGDTVFIVSIGRPDLGKKVVEWSRTLFNTLKTRISNLPEDLVVLPSHFSDWGKEADQNLCISKVFSEVMASNEEIYGITDVEQFVSWVQENMREQPPEYNDIRLFNCGMLEIDDDQKRVLDLGKNQCAASTHLR